MCLLPRGSRVWGSVMGQRAGVLPCGVCWLFVSRSCGEPSPVPWISWAPGASLMGAQTLKVAEEETQRDLELRGAWRCVARAWEGCSDPEGHRERDVRRSWSPARRWRHPEPSNAWAQFDGSSLGAGHAATPGRPPVLELERCDTGDVEGTGLL